MRRIAGPRVALVAACCWRRRGWSAAGAPSALATARPHRPSRSSPCRCALGDIVTDGHGHAYVTNPSQNRVEVLNLATATLEAPIGWVLSPGGLDVSPDGDDAYVANRGDHFVSVVDLAQRVEVRRFRPSRRVRRLHPWSLAVASNGTALVGMAVPGNLTAYVRIWQIDLETGAITDRSGSARWRCGPVRDHSRVLLLSAFDPGTVTLYDAASDGFGEPRASGRRPLWDRRHRFPGGHGPRHCRARQGSSRFQSTIPRGEEQASPSTPPAQPPTAPSRQGEVLDLAAGRVTATIPLPGSLEPTQVAVSADGATLAVLVSSGIVVVPVSAAIPVPPCVPSSPAPMVVGACGRWSMSWSTEPGTPTPAIRP